MSFLQADSQRYLVLKAAILPILAHAALLGLYELDRKLAWTLLLFGVGFLGMVIGERLLAVAASPNVLAILAVGAILRVLVLPLEPSLSDDVYRYIWDGNVVVEGFNPYLLAPEDPVLEPLQGELWERLPHKDVPTVYPVVAEGMFALAARLPASLWVWKILLASVDLLTCGLLIFLLSRREVPLSRSVWYVWNPLVTIEVAGMGHVDGLGVAAVMLTMVLLQARPRRLLLGAMTAAAAILIKIVPILALPIWFRESKNSIRFLAASGLMILAGAIPVLWSVGGVPPGLVEYGVSWEFNGPLFEPLWRLLEKFDFPVVVSNTLDRVKEITGAHEFWNRFYPFNYSQFVAKLLLLCGLCTSVVLAWRQRDTVIALRRVFGSVVIFSATVYPWYLLWVLPWAAITRHKGWLMLSGLLMLCYIPQFTDVPLYPWVHAAIWIPFAGALLLCRRQRLH